MKLGYTNRSVIVDANTLAMEGVVGVAPCLQDVTRESKLEFQLPSAPTLVQVLAACPELLTSVWNWLRLLCRADRFQTSCRRLMNQIAFAPDLSDRDLAQDCWDMQRLSREERRRLARVVEISSESSIKLLLLTTTLQQILPSPLFMRGLCQITARIKIPRPHVSFMDNSISSGDYSHPLPDLVEVLDMPLFPSELCRFSEWPRELVGFTEAIRASISPNWAGKWNAAIIERAELYSRDLRQTEPAAKELDEVCVGWIAAHHAAYLLSLLAQTYAALTWFTAALRSMVVTNEFNARKKNAAEEDILIPRCDTFGRN